MNYAALVSALGADLGFSQREFRQFMFPVFLAGMQPGFTEWSERPEGSLYPIPCTDVSYEGVPKRPWRSQKTQNHSDR